MRYRVTFTETSIRTITVDAESVTALRKAWADRDDDLIDLADSRSVEIDSGYLGDIDIEEAP